MSCPFKEDWNSNIKFGSLQAVEYVVCFFATKDELIFCLATYWNVFKCEVMYNILYTLLIRYLVCITWSMSFCYCNFLNMRYLLYRKFPLCSLVAFFDCWLLSAGSCSKHYARVHGRICFRPSSHRKSLVWKWTRYPIYFIYLFIFVIIQKCISLISVFIYI